MQITRISIPVTVAEREALRVLAQQEMRKPREQARYLLQKELLRSGLLAEKVNTGVEGLRNHNTGVIGANA